MVRVVKHIDDSGSIDFEFVGFEYWEDFDALTNILINQMNAKAIEKLEGIYSRHWIFEKENVSFKLMYHEDTGNCLCPITKSEEECNFLDDLAHRMLKFINESLT